MRLRARREAAVLAGALFLVGASGARAQAVTGTVIDQVDRSPIVAAEVQVSGADGRPIGTVLTGPRGQFLIRLAGGEAPFRFEASAMGYESRSIPSFRVPAGDTLSLEVPLERRPLQFDTLHVLQRRGRIMGVTPGWVKLQRRQAEGRGIFLAGAIIHQADPPSLTAYLANIRGLAETSGEGGSTELTSHEGRRCMRTRVNEWMTPGELVEGSLDALDTRHVAAVEIYLSFRDVPDELQMWAHPCGLVNVWLWPAYCGGAGCPWGGAEDPPRPQ